MVNTSTRDTLIRAGTRLLLRRGYRGTGVQDVLAEARVPKGSFYHYFGTKEELGLEALRRYFEEHAAVLEQHLGNRSRSPLQRLENYFEALICGFTESEWSTGCLVGTLSQELAGQNERFRLALSEIYSRWRGRIADCLREAQGTGELGTDSDPEALADFCLAGWEGALQHMKIDRSEEPLRRFQQVLFGTVLKRPV